MAAVKIEYGSSFALTITLASLGTSSNRVSGRESTVVDNTTDKYLDYLVSGKITTGTSPTVNKEIDIWVYGQVEDTPTYPDVLDGADSDESFGSESARNIAMKLAAVLLVTAVSDVTYWIAPFSVAALFGGRLPKRWGVFVTHDTAVNLNSTGGNHAIYATPVYETVT